MNARKLLVCVGVAFLAVGLIGCSFSASASLNSEGKAVLHGKDKVLVAAMQPELPPPPPPPPPPPVIIMKAKVVGKKIEITEKVMFQKNKAVILPESDQLLKDVATVIKENAQLKKIRVEGHTSSEGSAKLNTKLSQSRAEAVKTYLVNLGIDTNILESVGYGPDKPIADNKTEEGREKNRRVEFNILSGAPEGETPAAEPAKTAEPVKAVEPVKAPVTKRVKGDKKEPKKVEGNTKEAKKATDEKKVVKKAAEPKK
ncbi:MAG: OmpA family protein [Deltaproteobacteria bacterium]|nr:OmpA family protein [Deltaproteobacteria bacterium]